MQRMGAHADFAHPWIGWQRHRHWWRQCSGARLLIDEVAYRAQMHGVLGEGGLDGTLQCLGAVGIEQSQQAARERSQVRAAAGRAQKQRGGSGRAVMQPVLGAVGARGAFV